eukprot:m.28335 g.28335  ORF g.28335 m.28335 type:complete len:760 (+) comp7995_c0_seq2:250-2529(+)
MGGCHSRKEELHDISCELQRIYTEAWISLVLNGDPACQNINDRIKDAAPGYFCFRPSNGMVSSVLLPHAKPVVLVWRPSGQSYPSKIRFYVVRSPTQTLLGGYEEFVIPIIAPPYERIVCGTRNFLQEIAGKYKQVCFEPPNQFKQLIAEETWMMRRQIPTCTCSARLHRRDNTVSLADNHPLRPGAIATLPPAQQEASVSGMMFSAEEEEQEENAPLLPSYEDVQRQRQMETNAATSQVNSLTCVSCGHISRQSSRFCCACGALMPASSAKPGPRVDLPSSVHIQVHVSGQEHVNGQEHVSGPSWTTQNADPTQTDKFETSPSNSHKEQSIQPDPENIRKQSSSSLTSSALMVPIEDNPQKDIEENPNSSSASKQEYTSFFPSDCPKCEDARRRNRKFCAKCGTRLPTKKVILDELVLHENQSLLPPLTNVSEQVVEADGTLSSTEAEPAASMFSLFGNKAPTVENVTSPSMEVPSEPFKLCSKQIQKTSQLLGEGNFGRVYSGSVKLSDGTIVPSAIKYIQNKELFLEEVDVFLEIEEIGSHPNIVRFYGYCIDTRKPFLVLELLGKNLESVLKKCRGAPPALSILITYCMEVCSAMVFFQENALIHGDLAARNVLTDSNGTCKVTDLGMSRIIAEEDEGVYSFAGKRKQIPFKHTAPEVLIYKQMSTSSDIWAYGVFLYEVFSLMANKYPGVPNPKILTHLREGNRLERPNLCPSQVYTEIMQKSWEWNPQDRPDFHKIDVFLQEHYAHTNEETSP